ncbi:hypothetical protein NKG94_24480 [Micromonospora sp. M12]
MRRAAVICTAAAVRTSTTVPPRARAHRSSPRRFRPASGNAFVVRRAYPTGELQWIFTADHQATALDADSDFVYVTFNSGELVLLGTEDGAVHARQELRVNGHRVVPLSLVRLGPDRLAIGTLDGRVLVCSLTASPDLASD